jgi:integrative and conjugative element protein (TIGR02256 family)
VYDVRAVTGELPYRRADGRHVNLAASARAVLERHRQTGKADEAGGILLGRVINETGDVVVDEATEPMLHDVRRRFAFFRRKQPTQRLVDRAWANSGGTRIYLGEWHSHPEERPSPSRPDLENWHAIVNGATYEQDDLVFVIIGTESLGVWTLRRGDEAPECLSARPSGEAKPGRHVATR